MKKLGLSLAAATLALGTLIAPAAMAAQDNEHYGMVVFLKGSEFFNWSYAGFQDAAATVGATTELQGPADWDASAESRAVDQLVAKGVKGIAVTAGDADTLIGSINAAMDAGVPVLTFDSDSPKSKRMLFVGTNNYNAGFSAGKAIGEDLGDKARVGVSLIPGLDSINHRLQGFKDGLASVAPGAKVIAEVNDEGDLQKAETVNTAMLQANPDINVIFCAHGNPATGALSATRNVGRMEGDKKVHVLAWSIDVPILQGIEEDEYGSTVAQNPYMMGVQSFWQLWSAAHPTQFDSLSNPGFGHVPTADLDTGVKILKKGDPAIKGLMTPPKI
ncbi:substrate-binding domain-containing protein [Cohaesibacter celericrescens]|uniref:Sugar ABC transporter substrate-binding protein n=1 Tax=Cohaesibacter celericrescens TaxID=2067669 RepID=A0A2N5XUY2_9HYPH|nr:substrate-binding domain-containing protein [Cohaesibacter celericrescens]PLW78323.1 sugar ABC transporter substrate-binding protein [Cohaesibacter celericrescens]